MDIAFHYPPELMSRLIEAIPKLCRSKQDLLTFFQGAGVSRTDMLPFQNLLKTDKESFNKYNVTRSVLTLLNERGERTLGERREILRRVVDFSDFSVCWPNDELAARGLVSHIRELVNVKDSVTRITLDRDAERAKRIAEQDARAAEQQERRSRRDRIKQDLYALFGQTDAHKRGKLLEGVLNALFQLDGLQVREAFTISGSCDEGVIEQIDGLVELDVHLYLVEMKWWNKPLGPGEVAQHLVRVYQRGGQARGIFISHTEFTPAAVISCRDGLAGGAIVMLCQLREIVDLLERQGDVREWLRAKVTASIADKNPYFLPGV